MYGRKIPHRHTHTYPQLFRIVRVCLSHSVRIFSHLYQKNWLRKVTLIAPCKGKITSNSNDEIHSISHQTEEYWKKLCGNWSVNEISIVIHDFIQFYHQSTLMSRSKRKYQKNRLNALHIKWENDWIRPHKYFRNKMFASHNFGHFKSMWIDRRKPRFSIWQKLFCTSSESITFYLCRGVDVLPFATLNNIDGNDAILYGKNTTLE